MLCNLLNCDLPCHLLLAEIAEIPDSFTGKRYRYLVKIKRQGTYRG